MLILFIEFIHRLHIAHIILIPSIWNYSDQQIRKTPNPTKRMTKIETCSSKMRIHFPNISIFLVGIASVPKFFGSFSTFNSPLNNAKGVDKMYFHVSNIKFYFLKLIHLFAIVWFGCNAPALWPRERWIRCVWKQKTCRFKWLATINGSTQTDHWPYHRFNAHGREEE